MLKRSLLLVFVVAATGCGGSAMSAAPTVAGAARVRPANVEDATIQNALDSAPDDPGFASSTRQFSVEPNAKAPAILMNFVATGFPYRGLPCFTCVKGVQTKDNIGLPGPYNDIPRGDHWMYTASYTDVSYKGNCKLAVAITNKSKTIDKFSTTAKNNKPTYYYMYWDTRKFPKYSGPATVTASLTCGSVGTQKTSASIFFE